MREIIVDDVKATQLLFSKVLPRLMSDDRSPLRPLFKSQFFMRMENFQGNCRESAGNYYYRIYVFSSAYIQKEVCASRKCFYCDFIPDKPSPALFLFEAHTKYFFSFSLRLVYYMWSCKCLCMRLNSAEKKRKEWKIFI